MYKLREKQNKQKKKHLTLMARLKLVADDVLYYYLLSLLSENEAWHRVVHMIFQPYFL